MLLGKLALPLAVLILTLTLFTIPFLKAEPQSPPTAEITSSDQHEENTDVEKSPEPAPTIAQGDIIKLIIIPLVAWLISLVVTNAITRYHLIRNLYVEIQANYDWYHSVRSRFDEWIRENLDNGTRDITQVERISWNIPLFFEVYNSSQDAIRSTLWGKEVKNIHTMYQVFSLIHSRMGALSREIDRVKSMKSTDTRVEAEKNTSKMFVEGYADNIFKDLAWLSAFENPLECSRSVFYTRSFYVWHALLILGAVVLGITIFYAARLI